MPFPLTTGGRVLPSPAALADVALHDARLAVGPGPSSWVPPLVASGELDPAVAVGLSALLIRAGDAGPVAEGARLAVALRHPPLASLLQAALDAHDVGVLLRPDPFVAGQSVEDALLLAWAALAPAEDPAIRAALLDRLRNAGLPALEIRVLAAHGSADEIRRWVPAILLEGVPEGAAAALAEGLGRDPDVAEAIREALAEAPSSLQADVARRTP